MSKKIKKRTHQVVVSRSIADLKFEGFRSFQRCHLHVGRVGPMISAGHSLNEVTVKAIWLVMTHRIDSLGSQTKISNHTLNLDD